MDDSVTKNIEEQLVAHLTESAKKRGKPLDAIDKNRPFFEAGVLDSLSLLDFVAFVEKQFGTEVASRDIVPENFGTLRSVSEYVARRLNGMKR